MDFFRKLWTGEKKKKQKKKISTNTKRQIVLMMPFLYWYSVGILYNELRSIRSLIAILFCTSFYIVPPKYLRSYLDFEKKTSNTNNLKNISLGFLFGSGSGILIDTIAHMLGYKFK
jgi:hypothetical protein